VIFNGGLEGGDSDILKVARMKEKNVCGIVLGKPLAEWRVGGLRARVTEREVLLPPASSSNFDAVLVSAKGACFRRCGAPWKHSFTLLTSAALCFNFFSDRFLLLCQAVKYVSLPTVDGEYKESKYVFTLKPKTSLTFGPR
jgi:hypothetical protein